MKRIADTSTIEEEESKRVKAVSWIQEVLETVGYTSDLVLYFDKYTLLTLCRLSKAMFEVMRDHVERELVFYGQPVTKTEDCLHKSKLFIPKHLKVFEANWDKVVKQMVLPEGIQSLKVYWNNSLPKLPSTLKELHIDSSGPLPPLPKHLQVLKVTNADLSPEQIPKSVRVLKVPGDDQHLLDNLPEGLEELDGTELYDTNLMNLPKRLKRLRLMSYNPELIKFPESLEQLTVQSFRDRPATNLPQGLRVLEISDYHKPKMELPKGLQILALPYNYKHPIDMVPPNLSLVMLGCGFMEDPACIESVCKMYAMGFRVTKEGGKYTGIFRLSRGLRL